jgi:acetyltransferase-like isoleucine patch superfamily enzyme
MFILFLAMIADRVVLLPGTRVGKQTVMGSGAQGRRNTNYEDGSTWMGNGAYAALQAAV